jgi:glutamine phosphoribosylpyrophosphate amidotransferase
MALSIPTDAVKNAILDSIDTYLDSHGYVQFEATGGTNLAKISLANPAFAAASGGSMSLDTSGELTNTDCTAGTLDHLSFYTTNDTEVLDFPASTATTSGFCRVSSLSIGSGDTIEITSCKLNMDNN